ncbi:hypothetical protein B0A52_00089 [Exophiala mesophila]|uniref:Carboxypeptidase D n=1 Tax=Exophiala mesophila TaxID=212818 RepID=A0A438NJ28_EXOME|nr:hypothetical protein B0A52_00089 [Exophiala mesophila]
MALALLSALCFLTSAQVAFSQFVSPPSNLTTKVGNANITVRYKEVPPGICEQDPDVKSYAGYADVAPGEHIFWWFFESRNIDPEDAPLTIWINGGPGSSSMIGLFQELGPCTISPHGEPLDNPYSWSNVTNIIFIDQPTQVGFSYSEAVPAYTDPNSGYLVQLPNDTCPEFASDWDCGTFSYWNQSLTANSTPAAAPNMWKTLQGFIGAFPQYAREGVYFTTESEYFLEQNAKNISGAAPINLEGVLIGNGWYDPLIQYEAFYNFSVFPGNTYDYDPLNQTVKDQWYLNLYGKGNCYDQTVDCNTRKINSICATADDFCFQQVESLYDIYLERDEYDFRYLTPNPFPPIYYVDYLNTPEVQEAIGAYVNFTEGNDAVWAAFVSTGDDDRELGLTASTKKLLESNVSVTMYYGDADYVCNWIGGEVVADRVQAKGYDNAGFVNITSSDGVVHGQVKQSGLFSFVRIYESGHLVPFFQPLVSLEMLDRAINGLDIATGTVDIGRTPGYLTNGTKFSTYREGNATVQFEVTPEDAIYNITTNMPQNATDDTEGSKSKRKNRRDDFKRSSNMRRREPYRSGARQKRALRNRQVDLRRWL